jgi:alanine racemase
MAVVKANAYGAGVRGIAPALERAGVERFAVVWAAEALELRALGITRPIVVLGHSFAHDAEAAVEHGVTLTVDSLDLGEALSASALRRGTTARVHVHVDSGLHREGLTPAQAIDLATRLRALPALEVEGLSTHMANADEPDDGFSATQDDVFAGVYAALDWVPYRHTANSASALRRPGLRYAGVRVGLSLHGVLPENTPGPQMRPILSLHARLARVFTIEPGEGVSYGLTWRAPRPSTIGLVPIGYADGWRRSLGNAGDVLVGGQRCPIVGRICMDQFLVDVTEVPGVAAGDEAVLIGRQGSAGMTAAEVAERAGTIPWDVFASLQARLPRIYHRNGAVELIA